MQYHDVAQRYVKHIIVDDFYIEVDVFKGEARPRYGNFEELFPMIKNRYHVFDSNKMPFQGFPETELELKDVLTMTQDHGKCSMTLAKRGGGRRHNARLILKYWSHDNYGRIHFSGHANIINGVMSMYVSNVPLLKSMSRRDEI